MDRITRGAARQPYWDGLIELRVLRTRSGKVVPMRSFDPQGDDIRVRADATWHRVPPQTALIGRAMRANGRERNQWHSYLGGPEMRPRAIIDRAPLLRTITWESSSSAKGIALHGQRMGSDHKPIPGRAVPEFHAHLRNATGRRRRSARLLLRPFRSRPNVLPMKSIMRWRYAQNCTHKCM